MAVAEELAILVPSAAALAPVPAPVAQMEVQLEDEQLEAFVSSWSMLLSVHPSR